LTFPDNILGAESQSAKTLSALHKSGIIDPVDGLVHTERITKQFASQHAIISVHAQRKLVSLLFFWEEELMRWRLLDEEEAEITKAMEYNGDKDENLVLALRTVQLKRKLMPSERALMLTRSAEEEELPGYGEEHGTHHVAMGESRNQRTRVAVRARHEAATVVIRNDATRASV
jgi:hypothetical protein